MESSKDRKDQGNLPPMSAFKLPNNQNSQNPQRAQTRTANNQEDTKQIPTKNQNPPSLAVVSNIPKNPMAAYKSPQSTIIIPSRPETQNSRIPIEETKAPAPTITQNERTLEAKEKSTPYSSSNPATRIEENKSFWDIKPTNTNDLIRPLITKNDVELIQKISPPVKKSTKPPETNSSQYVQVKPSTEPEVLPIKKSQGEGNYQQIVNNEEMNRIFSSENKISQVRKPLTKDATKDMPISSQTKAESKTQSEITPNRLYSSEIIQSKNKNQEIKQNNSFKAPSQTQVSVNQKPVQIVPPPQLLERPIVSNPPPQAERMHYFAKPDQFSPNPQSDRKVAQSGNIQAQPLLPSSQNLQAGQSKDKTPSLNAVLEKLKNPSPVISQQPTSQTNTPNPYPAPTVKPQSNNQTNIWSPSPSSAPKQPNPSPFSVPSQLSFNQSNLSYASPYPAPKQQSPSQSNLVPNSLPSQPKPQPLLQSNVPNVYSPSVPKQQAASQNDAPYWYSSQAPKQPTPNQNNIPNQYAPPAPKQISSIQSNVRNSSPAPKQAPLSQSNINEKSYNANPSPAHIRPISQNNFKNDIASASKPRSESYNKQNFSSNPRDISPIVYNREPSPFNRYSAPVQDNIRSPPIGAQPPYQLANNYSQPTQINKAEIPDLYKSSNNFDNQRLRDLRPPINIPPPPPYSQNTYPYDSQMSPYEDPCFIQNQAMPINPPIKRALNYEELFNYVLDFEFIKLGLDAMDPEEIPSIFNSPYEYEKWFKPAFYEEFNAYLMRAYNEINKTKYIKSMLEIHHDYGKIRRSYFEDSLQNHEILIMIPESLLIGRSNNPLQYIEDKNFYKIGIINKLPPPKGCRIIWKNGRALEPYKEQNFRIYTLDRMVSSSREFSIFQLLPFFKLQQYVLAPNLALKEPLSDELEEYLASIHNEFNEYQFNAIREILQVTEGVSLLQGPPGTGKTKTIVGILSGFLTRTRLRRFPNILICAPSNIAIDEIGLRIVRNGIFIGGQDPDSIMIIRIGKRKLWEGKDSNNEEVDEIKSMRLEFLIDQKLRELGKKDTRKDIEKANKEIEEFKGLQGLQDLGEETEINMYIEQLQQDLVMLKRRLKDFEDAKKAIRADLVKRANVILTTLSGAASEMLKAKTFDYVIIDEACQSIELSSLIPFQYNPRHVVLVGDPDQLPSTMLSEKSEKNKFGRSLFERLAKNGAEYSFLNTQYRMNQEICTFPSNNFYEGRLVCAPGFFENRPIPEWINPSGIMFFDLESSEEKREESETSYYNREEAVFIEEIYRYIKIRSQSKNIEIGIITPYTKQTETIQTQLTRFHEKEWEKHVEVGTIDGFQGREKDVIILSLVRTEGIGFLWNKKRINVSLTRSKFGLWVVGKADCLQGDETWGAFIQHCRDQQKLVTCFGFNDVAHYFSKESSSSAWSGYYD